MSGILTRTVLIHYYKDRSGKELAMLHDWSKVTTGLGAMVEPGRPFNRYNRDNSGSIPYDPVNDMIGRVDSIEFVHMGKEKAIFADEAGVILHGGSIMPRSGW